MNKNRRFWALILASLLFVLFFGFSQGTLAAEGKTEKDGLDFLENIDYPELQVVPRASERLEREGTNEREGGAWMNQWTFLLTGTATLGAAMMVSSSNSSPNPDQTNKIRFAQATGAASLTLGLYYVFSQPYSTGLEKIKTIKVTGKRQQLFRERLSEEVLEKNARNIGSLSTISFVANLLAAALVSDAGGDQNSKIYSYGAMLVSSLSLIFPNPYVTNWEKQKEYKHKIYSPLPQTGLYLEPVTGKLHPYLGLAWNW